MSHESMAMRELDDETLQAASGGFIAALRDWFYAPSQGYVDASGPRGFGAGAVLSYDGRDAWYPDVMGPVPSDWPAAANPYGVLGTGSTGAVAYGGTGLGEYGAVAFDYY